MNYVVAMLLTVLERPEDAFFALIYVMDQLNWRGIFLDNTPMLVKIMSELERSIKMVLPAIHKHFTDKEINLNIVFSQIFISLYIQEVPSHYATKIFDLFLLDGQEFLVKFIVKQLEMQATKIMKLDEFGLI